MHDGHVSGASRTTGTLFGYRKARVTLAVQETPGSVPILLLELAMQTGRFMQEMGAEHLRVALECEKKPPGAGAGIGRTRLLDEPLSTSRCGRGCSAAWTGVIERFLFVGISCSGSFPP